MSEFLKTIGYVFNAKKLTALLLTILLFATGCSAKSQYGEEFAQSEKENAAAAETAAPCDSSFICRYHGALHVAQPVGILTYDIQMQRNDDGEVQTVNIVFSEYGGSKKIVQEIKYDLQWPVMPDTIEQGFQRIDIDNNGNDDFMLDLGILGHNHRFACFVYDEKTMKYEEVKGFEELECPQYLPLKKEVMCEMQEKFGFEKYCVEDSKLQITAKLTYKEIDNGSAYLFTEEEITNGKTNMVHKDVPPEEIDFKEWNNVFERFP